MKKLIFLILVIGFFGCEKEVVKIVYGPPTDGAGDQKVLVEEFTGKKCVNCPAGSKQLEGLGELNPGKIITVSIHAGFFSMPNNLFKYDFRTDSGNAIFEHLKAGNFYPAAAFNRIGDNGDYVFNSLDWPAKIQELVSQTSKASLNIETQFNEGTGELKVILNGIAKHNFNEDILANVLITESGIVDYQLDGANGPNENFVHNHVLRTALAPIPGIKITSSPSIGDSFKKEFSYIIPSDWKPENCKVIGYLSYSSKKEIIQVEESDLK